MPIKAKHILIVENDAIIALHLKIICKKNRNVYTHITYSKGVVEKIIEVKPDLILMDIEIKGEENIVDKAEHICNEFRIPIVFFTRAPTHSYQNHRLQDRCVFQNVPFKEEDVISAIDTLFKNYKYPGT